VSDWPEPTRDETEPPRWGWAVAFAAVAALAVWMLLRADRMDFLEQSWPPPEVTLRGRSEPSATATVRGRSEPSATATPEVSEAVPALSPNLFTTDVDGVITRPAAFKDCLALIFDTGNAVGVQPVLVEESANRTVARLPLQEGGVTITCSDGTMTIDSGAARP
jgi:hypothetical protein